MRTILSLALLFIALPSTRCLAGGDATLAYFLSKSHVVIAGQITSEPFGIVDEDGVVRYSFDFVTSSIVKGNPADGASLRVNAVRFEAVQGDELPTLKKGNRCILFLEAPHKGSWQTVDPWFGIQPYNSVMVESLKRLAAEEKKDKR